jgi:hypothetical protein
MANGLDGLQSFKNHPRVVNSNFVSSKPPERWGRKTSVSSPDKSGSGHARSQNIDSKPLKRGEHALEHYVVKTTGLVANERTFLEG